MLDRYDENLILGYLENDLEAADRARFEAMLAEDEPLALLIDQLIADRSMLRALPAREAPAILMEQVQCELERQMLVDVAPKRIVVASPRSPVIYRFSSRLRWAGAIAAMLAIGAGLTWHFDPLGWSHTTPPVTEVAINDIVPDKTGETQDAKIQSGALAKNQSHGDRSADYALALQADEKQAGQKPDNRAAIASADALPSIGSPHEAGGTGEVLPASPGGKATAALAMAQGDAPSALSGSAPLATAPPAPTSPSPVVPAPGAPVVTATTPDAAPSGDNAIAIAKPMAGATSAPAPSFQIELQTENVSQTRELLLAWAHQNDAIEPHHDGKARSRAMVREQSTFGADSVPQATRENKKQQQERDTDTVQGSDKVEAKELAKAETQAGAAEQESAASRGGTPAAGKSLAGAQPAKRGLRAEPNAQGGAQEIPSAARSALASPGGSPPAPAAQSVTLMVPEDRIDLLVEHIEASTGQSLIVVRDGDQTLLLSPQVANRRATSRKQIEAEVAKSAEKQLEPFGDSASDSAHADRARSDANEAVDKAVIVAAEKSAKLPAKSDGVLADAAAAPLVAPKEKLAPASAPPAPGPASDPQKNAKADAKKDSSPQAKKAAVRQVMVKIIFAPEQ